jgi:hypothetical protein
VRASGAAKERKKKKSISHRVDFPITRSLYPLFKERKIEKKKKKKKKRQKCRVTMEFFPKYSARKKSAKAMCACT